MRDNAFNLATTNDYLMSLARLAAEAYISCSRPLAILLTGSIACAETDQYSDIDLVAYYDILPAKEQLWEARRCIEEASLKPIEPRTEFAVAEEYTISGIDGQIVHLPVGQVEREIATVLEHCSVDALLHKKLLGIEQGIALYGENLIQRWKASLADFPDALAREMIEQYSRKLFPVWYYQESFYQRDASLWLHQQLVETIQNLLGILAGLNRQYYSSFQFKRMHRYINRLPIAPPQLADRIESLLSSVPNKAIEEIEQLVEEIVVLVNDAFPEADVAAVRDTLRERQQPTVVKRGL